MTTTSTTSYQSVSGTVTIGAGRKREATLTESTDGARWIDYVTSGTGSLGNRRTIGSAHPYAATFVPDVEADHAEALASAPVAGTIDVDGTRYQARRTSRTMDWKVSEAVGWLPVLDDELGATFRTDAELAQEARLAAVPVQGTVVLRNGARREATLKPGATVANYRTPAGFVCEIDAAVFTPR